MPRDLKVYLEDILTAVLEKATGRTVKRRH